MGVLGSINDVGLWRILESKAGSGDFLERLNLIEPDFLSVLGDYCSILGYS